MARVIQFAEATERYRCRVCGLNHYPDEPWGADGDSPTYIICDCCGVEFGYGDTHQGNCAAIRKHWVEVENCRWSSPKLCPPDWRAADQLRRVPHAFKGDEDDLLIARVEKLTS